MARAGTTETACSSQGREVARGPAQIKLYTCRRFYPPLTRVPGRANKRHGVMFLKYYQGLNVPGATPGDRTETCMSEDRSQTAGTERG